MVGFEDLIFQKEIFNFFQKLKLHFSPTEMFFNSEASGPMYPPSFELELGQTYTKLYRFYSLVHLQKVKEEFLLEDKVPFQISSLK